MKPVLYLISFLIAFLLFAVQPMASKLVLPVLGGTPAVWNTAMLTFQTLLLVGYLYAHATVRYIAPRRQVLVHALLVLGSFALLPLAIHLESSERLIEQPMLSMFTTLITQLGLPFFVLASTAPLLQAWVSRSDTGIARTPYVLYSASNLGSLMALIGYVALLEPLMDLSLQQQVWSATYVSATLLLVLTGWQLLRTAKASPEVAVTDEPTRWRERGVWIGLAFLPSALSLGVTNYIAVDVASVPLLWVLPLAIYLLSFVDAFRARPALVSICTQLAPLVGLIALLLYGLQSHRSVYGFAFHILAFLTLAFALHGYLARFKPGTGKLTAYYVCLSVGGALGGVMNALLAPMLLSEALEYPLALLVASATAFWLRRQVIEGLPLDLRRLCKVVLTLIPTAVVLYGVFTLAEGAPFATIDPVRGMNAASLAGIISLLRFRGFTEAYTACVTVMALMITMMFAGVKGYDLIYRARNFYGVEKVFDRPEHQARYMMHNTTVHGVEPLKGPLEPVSYYAALKEVFDTVPSMRGRIAAIGLGAGSVQCYATRDQWFDYYEINPLVVALAQDTSYFRYLSDCPGKYRMLLGDGRILLAQAPEASYRAMILDAFSSDAIPAHLLTQEAFAMYLTKLTPDGVILIHTTNRHIDLWPLIARQAESAGLIAWGKNFKAPKDNPLVSETYWVVLARQEESIVRLTREYEGWQPLSIDPGARVWTDRYSNILPYLKILR